MGMIGRILEVLFSSKDGDQFVESEIDPGFGNNLTVQMFSVPGIDSAPKTGDAALVVEASGTHAAVGCADTGALSEAEQGEIVIYARNGAGDRVCRIACRSDGSIEITSDGDVNINGAKIDPSGKITAAELTVNGIAFSTHTHSQVLPLHTSGSGPTGVPQ